MANILTATEALDILRLDSTNAVVTLLLPAIDASIYTATGWNWAADATIDPLAKVAAQLLLVPWFEDPGMIGNVAAGGLGYDYVIGQLQAKALLLREVGIPLEPLALSGSFPAGGEVDIAIGVKPLLVFNHVMAAGVTSAVTLQTSAGAPVSVTNTLDITSKRMTITPAGALTAGTYYEIVLTNAPDTYGATLTETISFRTAI